MGLLFFSFKESRVRVDNPSSPFAIWNPWLEILFRKLSIFYSDRRRWRKRKRSHKATKHLRSSRRWRMTAFSWVSLLAGLYFSSCTRWTETSQESWTLLWHWTTPIHLFQMCRALFTGHTEDQIANMWASLEILEIWPRRGLSQWNVCCTSNRTWVCIPSIKSTLKTWKNLHGTPAPVPQRQMDPWSSLAHQSSQISELQVKKVSATHTKK